MNKERREKLAGLSSQLEDISAEIEGLQVEEQDYYDNMPESFQSGEKGDNAQGAIDAMGEALENISSVIENLETACE